MMLEPFTAHSNSLLSAQGIESEVQDCDWFGLGAEVVTACGFEGAPTVLIVVWLLNSLQL